MVGDRQLAEFNSVVILIVPIIYVAEYVSRSGQFNRSLNSERSILQYVVIHFTFVYSIGETMTTFRIKIGSTATHITHENVQCVSSENK